MSTPVTVREREEAIARATARRAQQSQKGVPTVRISPRRDVGSPPVIVTLTSKGVSAANSGGGGDGTQKSAVVSAVPNANGQKLGKKKKPRGRRFPMKPLERPTVEEIPVDVEAIEYDIDPDKIVVFSSRGPNEFLSTFYTAGIMMEGNEYLSVEHYFQACMLYTLAGPQYANVVKTWEGTKVKSEAKKLLDTAKVPRAKVDEWMRTFGLVLLQYALTHKFVRNLEMRSKLLETGDALLVQVYQRENIYATGCDEAKVRKWATENAGKRIKVPTTINGDTLTYVPLVGEGRNVLGFLMMKLRHDIREFIAQHEEAQFESLISEAQHMQLRSIPSDVSDTQ